MKKITAGSIADRVNRQQFIIWTETGACLAAVGMFITTYMGIIDQYWMSALLILHSVSGALSNPCRQLFLHDMVGQENLLSGVALTSSLRFATQSIGKPLGGLILLTLGAAVGFFVNALAFLPLISHIRSFFSFVWFLPGYPQHFGNCHTSRKCSLRDARKNHGDF